MGLLDNLAGNVLGSLVGGQAGPQGGGAGLNLVMQLLSGSGGLQGLVAAFQQQGLGNLVASWIGTGQNLPISADQLRSVLGEDRLSQLASQAGVSPDEVAQGLAQSLPTAVDTMTPSGVLPDDGALPDLGSLLK